VDLFCENIKNLAQAKAYERTISMFPNIIQPLVHHQLVDLMVDVVVVRHSYHHHHHHHQPDLRPGHQQSKHRSSLFDNRTHVVLLAGGRILLLRPKDERK